MVRIKLVTRKIKNPTGYFSQELIPAVCPGCGMTFGHSDRQFITHINRCEALQGKMILKDDYDNLKVKDDDMNAKSVKL